MKSSQPEIINEAWRIQFTSIPSVLFDIDVEHEALENLETEMFEVSRAAGIASYYQWGLDIGHHQDWDPYARMEDFINGAWTQDITKIGIRMQGWKT